MRNNYRPNRAIIMITSLHVVAKLLTVSIKSFGGSGVNVSQVKSSHLYLYSAFNNTNCDKATAQYQNGENSVNHVNDKIKHSIFS